MPLYLKSAPTKSFTDSAQSDVAERVNSIIADIRDNGDAAVRNYSEQFDQWSPEAFRLDDARVERVEHVGGPAGPRRPFPVDVEAVQTVSGHALIVPDRHATSSGAFP